jgi:hypothetical protein
MNQNPVLLLYVFRHDRGCTDPYHTDCSSDDKFTEPATTFDWNEKYYVVDADGTALLLDFGTKYHNQDVWNDIRVGETYQFRIRSRNIVGGGYRITGYIVGNQTESRLV